jgi:AAA+ superfamily predicted ATPase
MARADLLCDLIKYGMQQDRVNFRKVAEALSADERIKQHTVLAKKIEDLVNTPVKAIPSVNGTNSNPLLLKQGVLEQSLFWERIPKKRLDQLILPNSVRENCYDFIQEQTRADLLRSYSLEPRSRILFIGEPGNGKTSLAEALAENLMLPLLTVRYENIIGSYLGETANRLGKLFDYVKTKQCVLFFDEFETLGKERGDIHETGEIKRVVSSLLLQIDDLPSYVIVIAATNHDSLLDRASWRRFQLRMELPRPTRSNLEEWFVKFEKNKGFQFGLQPSTIAKKLLGLSYAEVEDVALTIYKQFVLCQSESTAKEISERVLRLWSAQVNKVKGNDMKENENA